MSLFKDEDVKKAIRASVSPAEVIEAVSPEKDTVKHALSVLYVASKRQESMFVVLQCSLNIPSNKTSGA
eukprot:13779101-Ditylum_brightwellii.AAC.1